MKLVCYICGGLGYVREAWFFGLWPRYKVCQCDWGWVEADVDWIVDTRGLIYTDIRGMRKKND